MTATTIKIDSEVRDRLNDLAADFGCTAGSMVERLLDEFLWRRQVDLAITQMSSMTAEEREEYQREVERWDSTLGDGLP